MLSAACDADLRSAFNFPNVVFLGRYARFPAKPYPYSGHNSDSQVRRGATGSFVLVKQTLLDSNQATDHIFALFFQ